MCKYKNHSNKIIYIFQYFSGLGLYFFKKIFYHFYLPKSDHIHCASYLLVTMYFQKLSDTRQHIHLSTVYLYACYFLKSLCPECIYVWYTQLWLMHTKNFLAFHYELQDLVIHFFCPHEVHPVSI